MASQVSVECTLLDTFLSFYTQLQGYKSVSTLLAGTYPHNYDCSRAGDVVTVDGQSLSIPAIVAASRYPWPLAKAQNGMTQIILSTDPAVRRDVQKSSDVINSMVKTGKSIYGVTTGVGGSGEICI